MCAKKRIVGKIFVHRRGFGFVEVTEGEDLFIPKTAIGGATHGDTVRARVTGSGKEGKGPEGEVVEVTERARSELGALVVTSRGNRAFATSPLLPEDKRVRSLPRRSLRSVPGSQSRLRTGAMGISRSGGNSIKFLATSMTPPKILWRHARRSRSLPLFRDG